VEQTKERRSVRFPIIATAEVFGVQLQTRLNGRTSDLSQYGCYVDIMNPFPVGTVVRVKLSHANGTFTATGTVADAQANLGMGIGFTDIAPDQRAILESWIAGVS